MITNAGVSSIESCFSQVSVSVSKVNLAGILISGSHLYILCFGLTFVSISYAVKRINPSGPIRMFMIRALIASSALA